MNAEITSPSENTRGFSWGLASLRARPLRYLGVASVIFLRSFMGIFYLFAGINKFFQGYLWSDYLRERLSVRLTQIDPDSFAAAFLTHFAIPLHMPTAYIVCLGEIAAGVMLLFGVMSRIGAWAALWFIVMFAIGGFWDFSLVPLGLICLLIALTPSGRWLGFDRRLAARRPDSRWFA
jgi:thiosulfate dehydrogenase [quinone] large subunit